jgi:hypothetical protein
MAGCQIFYNIALRLIYKDLNDEKTKQLLLDLLERMVKSTENSVDDEIFELVKHKLYSKPSSRV